MSEKKGIPNCWEIVKLSEIISDLHSGKRPKGGVRGIEGGVPSIGAEHLNDEGTFKFGKIKFVPIDFANKMTKGIIKAKDIIVVKDGATTGKTSFVKANFPFKYAVINEHVFIIRLLKGVLSEFAFYRIWSQTGKNEILEDFRGAAQGGISSSFINYVNIPLPPLPEQHRIVAKIEELFSSLDKGIESLKTAQQQLKVYRQAVLKWAFEGKLTNKNVVGGKLPEGWTRIILKELVDKISDGPFGSNLKTSDYVDNGVRVIRLENIGYMEFRNEFQAFVTTEKYETIKKHTVSKGDIIFSSFISENIRTAILPDFIDRAINKADCFLVRPSEDKICNKYLFYYFSTREMYQQLIGKIHGATRPRINTTQLKSCLIPIAPIPEQHAIVAEIDSRLSVCDKIEESIEQSLKHSEALRQSILKKAFEGRLVSQDPNDEPASALLDRIRKERSEETASQVTPRRRR